LNAKTTFSIQEKSLSTRKAFFHLLIFLTANFKAIHTFTSIVTATLNHFEQFLTNIRNGRKLGAPAQPPLLTTFHWIIFKKPVQRCKL